MLFRSIAHCHEMLLYQLLVKMHHVEVKILIPVQPQHFLNHRNRHPSRTLSPHPSVMQPVKSPLIVLLPHSPRCRQLIPKISAASIQLIFFAYALNIMSPRFIARSQLAPGYDLIAVFSPASNLLPFAQTGHLICYLNRTS